MQIAYLETLTNIMRIYLSPHAWEPIEKPL